MFSNRICLCFHQTRNCIIHTYLTTNESFCRRALLPRLRSTQILHFASKYALRAHVGHSNNIVNIKIAQRKRLLHSYSFVSVISSEIVYAYTVGDDLFVKPENEFIQPNVAIKLKPPWNTAPFFIKQYPWQQKSRQQRLSSPYVYFQLTDAQGIIKGNMITGWISAFVKEAIIILSPPRRLISTIRCR